MDTLAALSLMAIWGSIFPLTSSRTSTVVFGALLALAGWCWLILISWMQQR